MWRGLLKMENIEKTEKGIGWLERVMALVDKYSIWNFFKAFFVITIIAILVGLISNPTYFFEKWEEYQDIQHQTELAITEKNNVLIQSEVEGLLWQTKADRVVLLSYHNSKKSLAGVPYIYLTATHEYFADGVAPIAEGYSAVKTSLYPMINYINTKNYFCGDIEELRSIDKALAYRMEGNDVKHFAMMQIDGVVPLGVLVVTYTNPVDKNHICVDVENILRRSARKLAVYMSGEIKK